MEDKVIELADWLIDQSWTYSEAMADLEKFSEKVSHEITLRALESRTRKENT